MQPFQMVEDEVEDIPASEEVFVDPAFASAADVDARIISDAPVAEPPATEFVPEVAQAAPPVPEPEIDFSQTEKPAKSAEVKHVKVRSSIDIMAELESLRKRATQTTPKAPKKDLSPLELLMRGKKDLQKTVAVSVPANVLPRARTVRVTLSFEEQNSGVIHEQQQSVELGDAHEVQSLSVNLKIEPA
jgi:hypothetical protein